MKKIISLVTAFIMTISLVVITNASSPTNNQQVQWLVNGNFSFEFELPPTAAQIEAGTHGQRGVMEAKDGHVRVFHRNADEKIQRKSNDGGF